MNPQQAIIAFLMLLLIGLSIHEYWQPQVSALI
jgi:hypothetical protein